MTSDGQSVERLREYLKRLKPKARGLLLAQLERKLLRGEDDPASEFVLHELRTVVRAAAHPAPRLGDAARMFYAPLEPFMIDGPADQKRVGRIARAALTPIWLWINRDLVPADAASLSQSINKALLASEWIKVDQLVRTLHETVIDHVRTAVAEAETDERARRRLAGQVGTPNAMTDLNTLLTVLSLRDLFPQVMRQLPNHVRTLEREQIDAIKILLDTAAVQTSRGMVGMHQSDVFLYGLVATMSRLAAPWQLVRIATRAAGSDEPGRIAETPFAAAVTIVLNDLECALEDLRFDLKMGQPVVSFLKNIHDAARGLRAEINLTLDSAWSRHLAAMCGAVSDLLRGEIEATPGKVRRLLRPRPAEDVTPGMQLDEIDVDEAEVKVEFVCACSHYADELALSEVTLRARTELTQYLEGGTKVLLEGLRHAQHRERPFKRSQLEASIRFCKLVFGTEYAGFLAKAVEVALQGPTVERKLTPA